MSSWPLEWFAILGRQPPSFLVQDRHVRGWVLHFEAQFGALRRDGGILEVGFDFCHMILLHREPHLGRRHQTTPTAHVGLKRRLRTFATVAHVKRHQPLGDGAFIHEGQQHFGRFVGRALLGIQSFFLDSVTPGSAQRQVVHGRPQGFARLKLFVKRTKHPSGGARGRHPQSQT